MTLIEFARLVAEMRQTQKDYFRIRSTGILSESKRLERQVDKAVEEVLQQPTLDLR